MSFRQVAAKIAGKEGIPMKNADAILASSSRNASPAAKKANPNLSKVTGAPRSDGGKFAPKDPHNAMKTIHDMPNAPVRRMGR